MTGSAEDRSSRPTREFSGRSIGLLVACIVGVVLGPTGLLLNSFSLFVQPIGQEFGWTRADIMTLITALGVGVAVSSPAKGWLMERFSTRVILLLCTAVVAALLGLLSGVRSWTIAILLFAIVGLCAPANLPYGKIIGLWFRRRRGLAYGIFGLGFGIGGAISLIFGRMLVDGLGWRQTLLVYGALELFVALPSFWIFFHAPTRWLPEPKADRVELSGDSLHEVLVSRRYWLLLFNLVATVFAMSALIAHGVPILVEGGADRATAAMSFSSLWIGMSLSQIVLGISLDRFDTRLVVLPFGVCALFGIVLLGTGGATASALAVLLIGFGGGGECGTTQFFIARYFGLRYFTAVYGSISPFTFAISVGVGSWLPGLLHDRSGSYASTLWICFLAVSIATLSVIFLGKFRFGPDGGKTIADCRIAGVRARKNRLLAPAATEGRTVEGSGRAQ